MILAQLGTRYLISLDIQEYLLLKGVEAVAIHGSKSKSSPRLNPNLFSLGYSPRRATVCHQVVQVWQEGRDGCIRRCV